jgi:ligand-binding sensor domain-containing protein
VAVCAQPLVPRPAYNQPIQFSHLTTGNGLLQSHITCILQDRRGLIWLGTRNGLYRYNGYDFQPFLRSINDSTSLPDNFIRSLCQDRQGRIWIGTDKGVCRYRTESNDFLRYGGMTGQVQSIVQHADGNIYCSSGILYVIDTSELLLYVIQYVKKMKHMLYCLITFKL